MSLFVFNYIKMINEEAADMSDLSLYKAIICPVENDEIFSKLFLSEAYRTFLTSLVDDNYIFLFWVYLGFFQLNSI